MRYLKVLPALLFLAGCSFSPSADFINALGKDPATVNMRVMTPYGSIFYCRTAILNGNVSCNADGIAVKSEAQSFGVPINVVPQVSIGAPVLAPKP